jgi:hypothetical protein
VVDCIDKPLKIYCDNQPAVFYAHNNKSSKATKPIEVKYYVVKDKIQDQTIRLEHIRTKDIRLTTQCVQGTLSRHGFNGKPMIPGS